jgi:uncharacterized surface anchored protein
MRKHSSRCARARQGRSILLTGLLMLVAVPAFASPASAALPVSPAPAFQFVNDENGADDQPGQKDLSAQAVATPTPGELWTSWLWDVTSLSGGNTGDACSLFTTDADTKINFAVCVTIGGNPAAQLTANSPRVFSCGNGKVDRCTSTSTQITPINTACATNVNATDPFHAGQKDTQAVCHIDLADVGGAGAAKLVNTCSYPSQQPTSDPSDCVLIPRDAFVTIVKVANPNAGSFPFRLGADAASANPVVFTASGSQTSTPIPIRSGVNVNLKEDVPLNWAVDGTPSCTGATGAGTSNGTGTAGGDTIAAIKAASDNVITCTYNDKQLSGAIRITKLRSGTSVALSGAHFSVDGAGDYTTGADGTVCVAGLTIGAHTVLETAAPNGHSVASPASQSVSVSAAATCSSGTPATVTFNDPVVPGTINIHKTGNGGALQGAAFTLFVDNPTVGGTRTGADTITTKTCTTNASGDCSITGVAPGDYWLVETTTPNGFITAGDRAVNVGIGTSAGQGDTDSITIDDAVAAGTINVHKTGLNGAALVGATFTLHIDAPIVGGALGVNDTATSKTCTTDASGDCSITGVAPGDYWLVETTTPPGYDTADPKSVSVPLGSGANQGATVSVTISDPVVPGTVVIHKTGIGGSDLNGAQFTLYADAAPIGTLGNEDTATSKTCTTSGAGACSITGVAPGRYMVVESITPPGYDTAAPQAVDVGIGATAHVGDSDSLTFVDAVVNGKVSITKTDDSTNPNALNGAQFTLYVDNPTVGGTRTAADTITTKKCTTGATGTGTCDITNVAPGTYWVVETVTPDHYDTAADKAITVGLGSVAGQGDTVPVSFVDDRRHRVVVLVCHEGTNTLFSRDVTVGGVTKQSLSNAGLTDAQQAALCNAGGASFGDISGHADVNALVALGKLNGAPAP